MYADVLLPLALTGVLTYRLPETMKQEAVVGSRVVVEVGKRKLYTGIIIGLRANAPTGDFKVKEVQEVVDKQPILLPQQWQLWQWMAHYYMCTTGEVMKAAVPSGLKMESEMVVVLDNTLDKYDMLSPVELKIVEILEKNTKPYTLAQLAQAIGKKGVQTPILRLLEKGVVKVSESLNRKFRPRTETHIRLTTTYQDETVIHSLFESGGLSTKQAHLLTTYLSLSQATTALKLQNSTLLQEVSKKKLLEKAEVSKLILSTLCKRGILEAYDLIIERQQKTQQGTGITQALSSAQQVALETIETFFKERERELQQKITNQPKVCLLHGVTSSGKTEIYTELILRTIERGEQVLFLVPEIALTTQLTKRLGKVFGEKMGVYHSKFPDAERVELWQRQLSERAHPLIVGVRSSLFLPFQHLGLIIVDEEHEQSYKQQDPAPRYHARDTALMLASQLGAKVLLGTATPAVETYRAALSGRYGLVELATRFGEVQLPEIVVENIAELRRKRLMHTPFSPRLIEEIGKALENKEQVILFQNRRGYAPQVVCRSCGWTPRCTVCDVTLTYHTSIQSLVCHYCGKTTSIPQQCPSCQEKDLREVGYGTERIEEIVAELFPQARTARMDLDTTTSRTTYERILQNFEKGETDILIGTQMVTKGLDFERVRIVGILYADQMMNIPDFRAYERAYQMMSQVAGRAGRRGKQGLVVLQTMQTEASVVKQVCQSDYGGMYAEAFYERKAYHYPPFSRLIYIYFKHREAVVAESAAYAFATLLRPHFGTDLLGPDKPSVGRVQSFYIRKLLLKASPKFSATSVRKTLWATYNALQVDTSYRNVTIYFDVDPL